MTKASGSPLPEDATGEEGIEQHLERIARNLLTLEVNTILKENITGTPMPRVAQAFVDVADGYEAELQRLGHAPNILSSPGSASRDVFTALAGAAKAIHRDVPGTRDPKKTYGQAELLMVCRIQENSELLERVLAAWEKRESVTAVFTRSETPRVRLLPAEMMTLRKVWEIGTEEIVMQTVIQLDGDVVTRLRRSVAAVKDAPILGVHASAVQTSVGTWNQLVETVGAFMNGIARLFLGK